VQRSSEKDRLKTHPQSDAGWPASLFCFRTSTNPDARKRDFTDGRKTAAGENFGRRIYQITQEKFMTDMASLTGQRIGSTTHFPESPERRDQYAGAQKEMNLSSTERNISIAAGAALGVLVLSKPLSMRGLVAAVLGGAMLHRGMSGYCSLYHALGIDTRDKSSEPSVKPGAYFKDGVHVEHSLTINKSPDEMYDFWRNFENLPKFMDHIKSVRVIDDRKSHWTARGPLNYSVEWDAEIINDERGKLISWRTTGAAEVDNAGTVKFTPAPNDGGTEVHVTLDYIPPAGKAGHAIAKLFGADPKTQIKNDLRKLKQMFEAGEVSTNANGEPRGTCTR